MDDVPAACFGYWEGLNDPEAHRELLSHAEQWAREKGAKKLYGPINFSTYYAYRIRTEGFWMNLRFPGECYNPEYYQSLLEGLGYTERESYLSLAQMIMRFPPLRRLLRFISEAQFGRVKGNGPDA